MPKLSRGLLRHARRAHTSTGHQTIRWSNNPMVSVIIPVFNERRTIGSVLSSVSNVHPHTEAIVIANGTTDGSCQIAEQLGARVIRFAECLGHDVGRAVGAKHARGDILLFTDGDIVIPSSELKTLVDAVAKGTDVALNSYSGPTGRKSDVNGVVLAKHVLNVALSRPDLRGASLTTIPHALSRRALNAIGADMLAVPPKAQVIAIHKGMRVAGVRMIDVGRKNPIRRRGTGKDPVESLIIGDHYEALHWLTQVVDVRGGHSDLGRMRETVR